ncbi:MAG TPA: CPBP family glutamic-type intramembrane protease [Magnetospirillaceae bacterium]|jgi:CRP-like cAMP-binding protein
MTEIVAKAPIFASSPLLQGLDDAQVAVLRTACAVRDYVAGDEMLAVGTVSDGVQFIESGAAEVLATSNEGGRLAVVATLGSGQAYGELSALTGNPAISTVRAAETPTRVQTLALDRLDELSGGLAISHTLVRNIVRVNQSRLSATNASYAKQLEETLQLLALRTSSARFFILALSLMSITLLTNHFLSQRPGFDVYSAKFAWVMLITLVLPTFALAWYEKFPLEIFGITTRNLGRDLKWSSIIVVVAIVVGAAGLWAVGYPVAQRIRWDYLYEYGPLYLVHSALQEFMGRGVLLGMMLRVFESRTWRQRQFANVAVSMMFALVHIHFGLQTVAMLGVFSLLLGSYFLIFRNLAGPILIHWLLGLVAFSMGLL